MSKSTQMTLLGATLEPVQDPPPGICERCGRERELQRHHLSYVPERTAMLCRRCHNRVHADSGSPFAPEQQPNALFRSPPPEAAPPADATVTIKRIANNSYFYWVWREDKKLRSEYICPVDDAAAHDQFIGEVL